MLQATTSLLLLSLCSLVQAVTLAGTIVLPSLSGQNASIPTASKIILDHGLSTALIGKDGAFSLHDVEEGEHIISAHVQGWAFPSLLVTITDQTHIQLHHPGKTPLPPSSPSLPYPIRLHPLRKEDYYSAKSSVNILGLLKSPMVLMMLASGGMMFVLPKVMASVEADPEMKREMAEARKMLTGGGSIADVIKSAAAGEAAKANNGARRRK